MQDVPGRAARRRAAARVGRSEGLDLAALARILYLSAGVVRVVEREDRPTLLLRAAGSAGGRFPYELYVAARDGVHWYDPVGHALVQVGPPPAGEATTLILTGVPWRTGWRYSERGLRHIYWDAGTVLAQTLALADGLEPRLWTTFPDEQVTRLVGADGTHEFPLALVTLGDGRPAVEPQRRCGGRRDRHARAARVPARHARPARRRRRPVGAPWPPAPPPPGDLDAVILRRGSTRIMDPGATISRAVFTACARPRAARHPDHRVHRRPRRRRHGAGPVPLARHRHAAARRLAARRALQGLHGAGARPRCRVRRDGGRRPRPASTTADTATPSSAPDSSTAACTSPPSASASARPG